MTELARLNAEMDAALGERVLLHRSREAKQIGVPEYIDGLRHVRAVEAEVEPLRKALGARFSRAYEVVSARSDGYYYIQQPTLGDSEQMNGDDNGGLDLGGAEEEVTKDPFAQVPADVEAEQEPEGPSGLEELPAEEEPEPVAEPVSEEPDPDADPTPLPGEAAEPVEEEPVSTEPEPEAEAEPEPEPEAEAAAAEPGQTEPEPAKETNKQGTSERPYVILVENKDGGFDKATDEPVKATNGDVALRVAYAKLVPEDSEESKTLVVIPEHYFKPKVVKAKKKVSRAVEID